jgi:hypothetical protein
LAEKKTTTDPEHNRSTPIPITCQRDDILVSTINLLDPLFPAQDLEPTERIPMPRRFFKSMGLGSLTHLHVKRITHRSRVPSEDVENRVNILPV